MKSFKQILFKNIHANVYILINLAPDYYTLRVCVCITQLKYLGCVCVCMQSHFSHVQLFVPYGL